MINTISLIVRTLEKIDHLARALLNDKNKVDEQLSQKDYEKLRGKVKKLLQRAITQERKKANKND